MKHIKYIFKVMIFTTIGIYIKIMHLIYVRKHFASAKLSVTEIIFFDINKPREDSSTGERAFVEMITSISHGYKSKLMYIKDDEDNINLVRVIFNLAKSIQELRILIKNGARLVVRTPEVFMLICCLVPSALMNSRIVYYSTDIFTKRYQDQIKNKFELGAFLHYLLFRFFEKDLWRSAIICLSNRADEAKEISKFNKNVHIVPLRTFKNFTSPSIKNLDAKKNNEKIEMIFVGSSGNVPNIAAMDFIVNSLLIKLFSKLNKPILLHVVGRGWSNISYKIDQNEDVSIQLHGNISDAELAKVYARSYFMLAPIVFGTGVKGKIIEGMYNSVIVITNNIGKEGIDCDELVELGNEDSMAKYAKKMYESSERCFKTLLGYKNYLKSNYSKIDITKLLFDID